MKDMEKEISNALAEVAKCDHIDKFSLIYA